MDKLSGIFIQMNTDWGQKGTLIDTYNIMGESQKHYTNWKKPYIKEYIVYDPIYMKFKTGKNLSWLKKIQKWLFWEFEQKWVPGMKTYFISW